MGNFTVTVFCVICFTLQRFARYGGWWRCALVSPVGVAPSRMVSVSASVYLPLHHEVQKFSSGTGSPGWSRKKGPRRLCVRWGPSPPPQKGGRAPPQFSPNFYWAKTAGCIVMPLGMEVSLSPGDFVFDWEKRTVKRLWCSCLVLKQHTLIFDCIAVFNKLLYGELRN